MGDNEPSKEEVWQSWITEHVNTSDPVPLFATEDGVVQIKQHGRDNRPILERSPEMESMLRMEAGKVVEDWKGDGDTYEGVIYMMYVLRDGDVVPRYIGKAGKYGRDGERLSANLKGIESGTNKFARWGDGYAYHLGELSSALLDHHQNPEVNKDSPAPGKYQRWADELFVDGTRRLEEPVYFWTKAWRVDDAGPFYGFETKLEALEYQLINLASDLYPSELFNSEGA
jgi:hypothetical protein